jgi:hypothetical protein
MPAYNFKPEFAPLVESGEKRQTIRKKRKRPTKAGDILYLKTGMRTKKCRGLKTVVCLSVRDFMMDENFWVGDIAISARDSFAFLDGFRPYVGAADKMTEFFEREYGLPFIGEVIRW